MKTEPTMSARIDPNSVRSGDAGTSAVMMEARATGAACSRGNRTHGSCFRGISVPIGSPILL
jgi:hypothetical protein